MQGEFTFFWSVLVPGVMVVGSIVLTYALYRHFAGKVSGGSSQSREEHS
jgi:hypothetical protein